MGGWVSKRWGVLCFSFERGGFELVLEYELKMRSKVLGFRYPRIGGLVADLSGSCRGLMGECP